MSIFNELHNVMIKAIEKKDLIELMKPVLVFGINLFFTK